MSASIILTSRPPYRPNQQLKGSVRFLQNLPLPHSHPIGISRVLLEFKGIAHTQTWENDNPYLISDIVLCNLQTQLSGPRDPDKAQNFDFDVRIPTVCNAANHFSGVPVTGFNSGGQSMPFSIMKSFPEINPEKRAQIQYMLIATVETSNKTVVSAVQEIKLRPYRANLQIPDSMTLSRLPSIVIPATINLPQIEFDTLMGLPDNLIIGQPYSLLLGYRTGYFEEHIDLMLVSFTLELQEIWKIQGLCHGGKYPNQAYPIYSSWKASTTLAAGQDLQMTLGKKTELGTRLNLKIARDNAPLPSISTYNIQLSYNIRIRAVLDSRGESYNVCSPESMVVIHAPHIDENPKIFKTPEKTAKTPATSPKTRYEDLGRQFGGMSFGRPNVPSVKMLGAPTPEKSPKEYTPAKIKERLAYFEKQRGASELTPRSLLFTELYMGTAKEALSTGSPNRRAELLGFIFTYDNFIQRNAFLCHDKTYEEDKLQQSLLKLRRMDYLLHYGDFFAREVTALKIGANALKSPGYDLLQGRYWTEIRTELEKDMEKIKKRPSPWPDVPTYMAIVYAAGALKLDSKRMIFCVQKYADRNTLAHSSMTEAIANGNFVALARMLAEDEKDLRLVIPPGDEDDIEMVYGLIEATKKEFFIIFDFYKDRPENWLLAPAAIKIVEEIAAKHDAMAKQRLEERRLQEIKNSQAAQKEIDKKARLVEATRLLTKAISASPAKRKASTNVPRGEELISEERRVLVEATIGLEKQIEEAKFLLEAREKAHKESQEHLNDLYSLQFEKTKALLEKK